MNLKPPYDSYLSTMEKFYSLESYVSIPSPFLIRYILLVVYITKIQRVSLTCIRVHD